MRWTSNARITIDVGSMLNAKVVEKDGPNLSSMKRSVCRGKSFRPFVREERRTTCTTSSESMSFAADDDADEGGATRFLETDTSRGACSSEASAFVRVCEVLSAGMAYGNTLNERATTDDIQKEIGKEQKMR